MTAFLLLLLMVLVPLASLMSFRLGRREGLWVAIDVVGKQAQQAADDFRRMRQDDPAYGGAANAVLMVREVIVEELGVELDR